MEKNEILNQITYVLREVLNNDSLILSETSVAADVEEWDSLSHVLIVVALEKHFGIRFTSREIQGWNNIGEMIISIQEKNNES